MQNEESRMIRRFCGAILECREMEPYKCYVQKAAKYVVEELTDNAQRQDLVEAIMLNVLNYKEYPFDFLQRRLHVGHHPQGIQPAQDHFLPSSGHRVRFIRRCADPLRQMDQGKRAGHALQHCGRGKWVYHQRRRGL